MSLKLVFMIDGFEKGYEEKRGRKTLYMKQRERHYVI